jgi:hypothetical protein
MYGFGAIAAAGGVVAAGLGAIFGLLMLIAGVALGLLWFAALASTFFVIVTESSEGNDIIQNWPSKNVPDWLPEFFYLLIAAAVSALPGWGLAHLAQDNPLLIGLFFATSGLLTFPIIVLSQLDIGSPFGIFSGRVLQSLFRCPLSWLTFYVETALLNAACSAIGYVVVTRALINPIWFTPVFVGAALLYARLLGRLAWQLAETMGIEIE